MAFSIIGPDLSIAVRKPSFNFFNIRSANKPAPHPISRTRSFDLIFITSTAQSNRVGIVVKNLQVLIFTIGFKSHFIYFAANSMIPSGPLFIHSISFLSSPFASNSNQIATGNAPHLFSTWPRERFL